MNFVDIITARAILLAVLNRFVNVVEIKFAVITGQHISHKPTSQIISMPKGAVAPIGILFIKQKPPAMPVDKRKTTQALAAERSRYTKKLLCAKLNVRLATVHK